MSPLEALDRMSVNDKLAHFARKDALRLPKKPGETWGAPMRLKREKLPRKLGAGSIDATGGNVIRQAYPVIGRPCFGIPTARLVHGREHMIRTNGKLALARCGECPVKQACQFIVDERLNANERIREAYREYKRRGGAEALWSKEGRGRSVGSALFVLVRELQAAGFTTINDAVVAAHYDDLARARRDADAERQRALRDRKAHESAPDREHRRDLAAEARELRDAIKDAQADAGCPRWLAGLRPNDVVRVWVVKVALTEQGEKHGATHIARALEKTSPLVGHDALRFRTARILKRLPQIEQVFRGAQFQSQSEAG